MKYKYLGRSGLEVSELGFGTIQLTRMEEKDAIDLIRYAHDQGITLVDTANTYFNSEVILGKALKGIRDDMVIISKSMSRNKKDFIKDINTSLSRLKTDFIDIYFIHFVSKDDQIDEVVNSGLIDVLIEEKKKGNIGHFGFSCHSSKIVKRLLEIEGCEVLMVPLNFIAWGL
jgi:aryl-alcohol dehydrogenase-like predicted oxidoreductase